MNPVFYRFCAFVASLGLVVAMLAVGAPMSAEAKTQTTAKKQAQGKASKSKSAASSKRGGAKKLSHARGKTARADKGQWVRTKSGKRVFKAKKGRLAAVVAPKPTFGQLAGLHNNMQDDLALKSSVAFIVDQDTHEVLFRKNESAVLPIASLTKLMTGLVVADARLSMAEPVVITDDDVDTEKGSRSRLKVGTTLTRGEMMHLSLMSSENRAANALGRNYPGGMPAFVAAMNAKAKSLGMTHTTYVEPTGLSSRNQSSARDLALLASAAAKEPSLREWSTSQSADVPVGDRVLSYRNTNRLTANPNWDIGLQKTGYISEAGQCLVMQTKVAGRKLIMVFLDSMGKYSRLGDAERVRNWLEATAAPVLPTRG